MNDVTDPFAAKMAAAIKNLHLTDPDAIAFLRLLLISSYQEGELAGMKMLANAIRGDDG